MDAVLPVIAINKETLCYKYGNFNKCLYFSWITPVSLF